ncbi:MAG: hypothetical protein ACUVSX_13415 [Aggregatilineales bacterium]
MLKRVWLVVVCAAALLALAGCQSRPAGGPSRSVFTRPARTVYFFQHGDPATWQVFTTPDEAAMFRVSDGALEGAVVADRGYIWSLNGVEHDDVIASAAVQLTQGALGSALGLICRADARGNGYYFLIANDGTFSIGVGTDARNDLFQLVPWQASSAVRPGTQPNTLRIVCVENYLALFVNDVFVAETFDDELRRGQLGVTLGAVEKTAWARFDDIAVQPAYMAGAR